MSKIKIQNKPIGPFPTALVGAEVDDRPNYATAGAFGVVSLEPVLYVSLKSTHYTTKGVKEHDFFSINIPSADMVQKTDYCGIVSGKQTDKSTIFTSFYDETGIAPMIVECPLNYLCKVVRNIPMFGFDFFLGEIISVYIDERCLVDNKIITQYINPIVLMGNEYWNLGNRIGLVFREGKKFKKVK